MKALNKRWIGFFTGLILPFFIVVALYLGSNTIAVDFSTFMRNGWNYRVFGTILPLALLINLAVFMLFIQRKKMRFCQGMVLSTAIYGVVILLMRI